MILAIRKIEGGLEWDGLTFQLTNTILPNGYEIQGEDFAYIEIENRVVMLCSNDSTIDGLGFSNIQDELNYIFGL